MLFNIDYFSCSDRLSIVFHYKNHGNKLNQVYFGGKTPSQKMEIIKSKNLETKPAPSKYLEGLLMRDLLKQCVIKAPTGRPYLATLPQTKD